MRHVGPVRRELGIQTVMNIVGPLANPAGVRRQVVGVADRSRLRLLADALRQLDAIRALVVHGEPGLDEISPLGRTTVVEVRDGAVTEWELDPSTFGLESGSAEDVAGGDPASNARLIEVILDGGGPPGARSAVLLNAAAAIYISGDGGEFGDAVAAAARSLESRAAQTVLARMRSAS
jgi:anthranilate phosphoribosyltransferase